MDKPKKPATCTQNKAIPHTQTITNNVNKT